MMTLRASRHAPALPFLRPGGSSRRRTAEMEFLPAALEILERPPSPSARIFTGAILAFAALAGAWSWFGQVDMVAVATGRVIPTGYSKTVQPMEIGVVRAIHVQDGRHVMAGEVLIDLDPTVSGAERDRLAAELAAVRTEAARLRAVLSDVGEPLAAYAPPAGAPEAVVRLHRQLLLSQMAEHRAKLATLDGELARRTAERATVAQSVAKLEATIPLARERAEALGQLASNGNASRLQYLALRETQVGQEQERLVQKARLVEADATIAAAAEQRRQLEAEFRRTAYGELAAAEQKIAGLTQELAKAEQRLGLQRLTAPVAGTVQQLAVHTVGGVVTPAQPLLVVVPDDSALEVEAFVSNQDIGFVQEGQEVEVKVDAFSFTKYGLLPGRVASVSRDAVQREEDRGKPDRVYAARIALERASLEVDGRMTGLTPGMAVTAEIKTGRRRILEYLLSPLQRATHEALKER